MALITLHLPISRVVVPTPYVRHIVSHLGGGATDVVLARFQLACCDFAAYTVRRCQTGDAYEVLGRHSDLITVQNLEGVQVKLTEVW